MQKIFSKTLSPNLKCVDFKSVNKSELYNFFVHIFHTYEPITRESQMTKTQVQQLMFNSLEKSYENGFSTAILNERDKLVSAKAIIEWKDYIQMQPVKNGSLKIRAIERILRQCNNLYQPKYNKSLVIFLDATDIEYVGQGLATYINIDLFRHAKNQGYKEMIVDCSQCNKIYQKAKGFQRKGGILYSQFQFNNEKPFKDIKNGINRYALNLDKIMSDQFYDYGTLKSGTSSMVELIEQLSIDDPHRLISPPVQPGFLRNVLSQSPPEKGSSIEQLLSDTKKYIYPGIMLWQSPRYFGYFPSTIAVTNVLAQMFATTFHSPAFNYSLSPSHTQLENITVDWSALAVGLPKKFLIKNEGGSIINTSTTQSILVTIHAAKRRKMQEIKIEQNSERIVKFVGYYGEFSFVGNQRGLKLKQIFHTRAAPAKYCQKTRNLVIDTEKFQNMIQQDVKNGLIPFFYGATYGTTYSCANDLNPEIIRICKKFGMWINVDAAYLGSSWICPQLRPDMTLFEQVNSITINFSKALFLGNGGALLFIADKKQLTRSMEENISFSFYKNQYTGREDVIDYKDWMLGLGRRNNSLKFFYLFKHYGLEKLRGYVRDTVKKAQHVTKRIENSKIFKLFSKPQFGLVCFQLCDKDGNPSSPLTKQLGEQVRNIEEGFMSPGSFKEWDILRFAIGNNSATTQIIDKYFDAIEAKGIELLQKNDKKQQI